MNIRKIAAATLLALTCLAPSLASAQVYDANQNIKTAAPSAPVATYTLSGTCATPLTPGTAAVSGGAAATGCVAAGSAIILPTSGGYAGFGLQVNTPNGGVFQVESSLDCSTYFASNVEVAGGSPSALAYSTTISLAGKYSGAATSPCVALVATTAPSAATTFYGYLFQAPVGTVLRGAVPLTALPGPGTNNVATNQVTLTATTAAIVVAARTGVPGTGRQSVTIVNNSTTAVYLGGSGVTSTSGLILPGVVGASVTLQTTGAIYGALSATGSAQLSYYELY